MSKLPARSNLGSNMEINFNIINKLPQPSLLELTDSPEQFLLSLTTPTIIDIQGKNQNGWRVITTLLHGNESSGFIALHQWLTELALGKLSTKTNLRIIISSVEAAQQTPLFSQRYLTHGKDINRCFTNAVTITNKCNYFKRAQLIKQAIDEVRPEAIIDLHNTSGTGPAFAVSTHCSSEALALSSLFCDTMIISHIHIGALMELKFSGQIITVECGGCNDLHAHETALTGIKKFTTVDNIIHNPNTHPISVIYKPLRLRLTAGTTLNYAKSNTKTVDLVLKSSIEKYNYHIISKNTEIGWLNKLEDNIFLLIDEHGHNVFSDFFLLKNNKLTCATDLKFFMATTNKDIALTDCLFYVVKTLTL